MSESAKKYSLCESLYACIPLPWHIRRLTEKGKKLGGGIDTPSLCGLVEKGWDLEVDISERQLEIACSRCVAIYRKETAE